MLTIQNYGHYWSRDLIHWGTRGKGNKGALEGTKSIAGTGTPIDFRLQAGIYILYGANREVVYVGQTGSGDQKLFSRLRQHARGSMRSRWTNFSWFGFYSVDSKSGQLVQATDPDKAVKGSYKDALDEVEAVLLQILEPKLNKQGPKWGDAVEYFQFSEHEDVSLEDLYERIEELTEKLVHAGVIADEGHAE